MGFHLGQLFDIRFGFAGEAHDEGGPQGDARHARADPVQEPVVGLPRPRAPHALEDRVRGVLQRQVDVPADFLRLGHRRQCLVVGEAAMNFGSRDARQARGIGRIVQHHVSLAIFFLRHAR